MKRLLFTLFSCFCLVTYVQAQQVAFQDIAWKRQTRGDKGDQFNRVRTTPFGDVVAAGSFADKANLETNNTGQVQLRSEGGLDCMMAMWDANGRFMYKLNFGGDGNDEILGLAPGPFGEVFITGYFSDEIEFEDANGREIELESAGGTDGFVARVDSRGRITWAFRFGGSGNDRGTGIDVARNGNLWVAGTFSNTFNLKGLFGTQQSLNSAGGTDAFLAKFSGVGSLFWAATAGGPGNDAAVAAAADRANNGFMLGTFTGSANFRTSNKLFTRSAVGGNDVFVLGMSNGGNLDYVTAMGGAGSEEANDLAADPRNQGVVAIGTFSGTSAFGSTSLTSTGGLDAYLVRLGTTGQVQWARRMGGTNMDLGQSVRMARNGQILVGMAFDTRVTMPGNTVITENNGWLTGLIARLTADGTGVLFSAKIMGPRGDDAVLGVDTSIRGGCYAAGMFHSRTRLRVLPNGGGGGLRQNAYVTYYGIANPKREGVNEEAVLAEVPTLQLAPNPAGLAEAQRLTATGFEGTVTLQMLDATGKLVSAQTADATTLAEGIELTGATQPGLYILVLTDAAGHKAQVRMAVR